MITWHIANNRIGDFSWELPKRTQEKLLMLPPEVQDEIENLLLDQIERVLLIISTIVNSGGEFAPAMYMAFEKHVSEALADSALMLENALKQ